MVKKKANKKCSPCKIQNCKCVQCKVPLSGFLYKIIAKPLFGVKPSKKKKGYCNKCE